MLSLPYVLKILVFFYFIFFFGLCLSAFIRFPFACYAFCLYVRFAFCLKGDILPIFRFGCMLFFTDCEIAQKKKPKKKNKQSQAIKMTKIANLRRNNAAKHTASHIQNKIQNSPKKRNKKHRIFIGDDGSFNWFENGKLKKRLSKMLGNEKEYPSSVDFEKEWYGIVNARYSAAQISFENDWSNLEM